MENPCSGALVEETAEALARHSYGKLVAFLAARTGNMAAAEDALSEAFAAALERLARQGLSIESRSLAADRGASQIH